LVIRRDINGIVPVKSGDICDLEEVEEDDDVSFFFKKIPFNIYFPFLPSCICAALLDRTWVIYIYICRNAFRDGRRSINGR
jgi:hypothetical protein